MQHLSLQFELGICDCGKDTIYTKLALMPWIDDNLGHTLSGLTQIGNIIAKIFIKFTIFLVQL